MKARLKSVILSAIGIVSAFSLVTLSSCDDKCKSVSCAYEGTCNEGKCICKTGYEGPQCETLTRKKFLGTWVVTEVGSISDGRQYTINIGEGPNLSQVKIANFYNFFKSPVNAFVKGDTINIISQDIDQYTIQGRGWIEDDHKYGDNGRIVVQYKVIDNEKNQTDDFGADGGTPSTWNK